MAAREDFTPDEWRTLEQAPIYVAFATLAADMSGPIGLVKEMEALTHALEADSLPDATNPASDLIAAVASDLRASQRAGQNWGQILGADAAHDPARGEEHPSAVPGSGLDFSSAEKVKEPALAACRAAATLLAQKASPGEAMAFGRWALSVGQQVAEAAKEGGFLGIGGSLVSEKERAMLDDMAAALGLPG
jgi:hypothetical protein